MSESYVECLVKKKTSGVMQLLRVLSIMLAVCFILVGLIVWPALIVGAVMAVAAYFIYLNSDLEYEYLYLDKELTVDKIMAKSKRKRVGVYDIERMEVFAPLNSYHLDSYRNRNVKAVDYSSSVASQPERRYALYYNGELKLILEPSAEMVKAVQMTAPRKVFTD